MDAGEFQQSVDALEKAVAATIAQFFTTKGDKFDRIRFEREGFHDLRQIAKDSHFYGAEVFPDLVN